MGRICTNSKKHENFLDSSLPGNGKHIPSKHKPWPVEDSSSNSDQINNFHKENGQRLHPRDKTSKNSLC